MESVVLIASVQMEARVAEETLCRLLPVEQDMEIKDLVVGMDTPPRQAVAGVVAAARVLRLHRWSEARVVQAAAL